MDGIYPHGLQMVAGADTGKHHERWVSDSNRCQDKFSCGMNGFTGILFSRIDIRIAGDSQFACRFEKGLAYGKRRDGI